MLFYESHVIEEKTEAHREVKWLSKAMKPVNGAGIWTQVACLMPEVLTSIHLSSELFSKSVFSPLSFLLILLLWPLVLDALIPVYWSNWVSNRPNNLPKPAELSNFKIYAFNIRSYSLS